MYNKKQNTIESLKIMICFCLSFFFFFFPPQKSVYARILNCLKSFWFEGLTFVCHFHLFYEYSKIRVEWEKIPTAKWVNEKQSRSKMLGLCTIVPSTRIAILFSEHAKIFAPCKKIRFSLDDHTLFSFRNLQLVTFVIWFIIWTICAMCKRLR